MPDFDTITLPLGGRFELGDEIFVAASYTQFVFLPRDNRKKSTLAQAPPPSAVPDAGAEYGQHIGALKLNAEFEFRSPQFREGPAVVPVGIVAWHSSCVASGDDV